MLDEGAVLEQFEGRWVTMLTLIRMPVWAF